MQKNQNIAAKFPGGSQEIDAVKCRVTFFSSLQINALAHINFLVQNLAKLNL